MQRQRLTAARAGIANLVEAAAQAQLDKERNEKAYSVHGGELQSVELHSQALLVALMWADLNQKTTWQQTDASKLLFEALYDSRLGHAIGLEIGTTGTVALWDQMQRMIAYSAIDEGALVFGDTAIKALFDDADDLGAIFSRPGVSS